MFWEPIQGQNSSEGPKNALKWTVKPTIFTIRNQIRYLVRDLVKYQILNEIRLNYKIRIIFVCSFKTPFSFFGTAFFREEPKLGFFYCDQKEAVRRPITTLDYTLLF